MTPTYSSRQKIVTPEKSISPRAARAAKTSNMPRGVVPVGKADRRVGLAQQRFRNNVGGDFARRERIAEHGERPVLTCDDHAYGPTSLVFSRHVRLMAS